MESHEPGHPDPSSMPVISGTTRVRDRATGDVGTADDWVNAHMERERRERPECVEELVNAIARGDVTIEA